MLFRSPAIRSQVAERLGNGASNQKVAGSIVGCAKLRSILGQGTSPYLPLGGMSLFLLYRPG